jgi:predicted Zn-dependent protease with MMP-like domain
VVRIAADEIEDLIATALDELPERFARYLDNVVVSAEDEPSQAEMNALGLSPRQTLFGVYRGVPRTRREANFAGLPDQIVIFRGPIVRSSATRREAIDRIRKTVLHEIGHHFGLSDADM